MDTFGTSEAEGVALVRFAQQLSSIRPLVETATSLRVLLGSVLLDYRYGKEKRLEKADEG